MTIGGDDIVLPGPWAAEDLETLERIVLLAWPEAVVERDDADATEPLGATRLAQPGEYFVYRDASSARAWARGGPPEVEAEPMLHLLLSDSEWTIVVDSPSSPTAELGRAIARRLLQDRAWSHGARCPAPREA